MKQLKKGQRVSGFTLIELIVVMGIIGILLAVLLPAMNGYITSSRLNTANANAKVLFSSAQTVMQEFEFRERQQQNSAFYGAAQPGAARPTGDFCVKRGADFSGNTTTNLTANITIAADTLGPAGPDSPAGTFGSRLSRLYDEYNTTSWAIHVENYTVRGVLVATNPTSRYVGGYPLRITARTGDADCELNACGITDIASVQIGDATTGMRRYRALAWNAPSPFPAPVPSPGP